VVGSYSHQLPLPSARCPASRDRGFFFFRAARQSTWPGFGSREPTACWGTRLVAPLQIRTVAKRPHLQGYERSEPAKPSEASPTEAPKPSRDPGAARGAVTGADPARALPSNWSMYQACAAAVRRPGGPLHPHEVGGPSAA
jgi:hypothetical protein